MYALSIIGPRSSFEEVDTLDELKELLKYYGLPMTLADFDSHKPNEYGMIEINYRHYKTIKYI